MDGSKELGIKEGAPEGSTTKLYNTKRVGNQNWRSGRLQKKRSEEEREDKILGTEQKNINGIASNPYPATGKYSAVLLSLRGNVPGKIARRKGELVFRKIEVLRETGAQSRWKRKCTNATQLKGEKQRALH